MHQRTVELLEFARVLHLLAGHCTSDAGRTASLALRPGDAEHTLVSAHPIVADVMSWVQEGGGFSLRAFPDLPVLPARQGADSHFDPESAWIIRFVLDLAQEGRRSVLEVGAERFPAMRAWAAEMSWPERVWSALRRCLSEDAAIRDESSPELAEVRQRLRRIHAQCRKKVTEDLSGSPVAEYLQDDYLTISSDRYVLALKSNFKGRVQGIVHDYSQTGETCYIEPYFLVELNNALRDLKEQERVEERKVLRYLTELVRQEHSAVCGAFEWLVQADLYNAVAAFARVFDARFIPMEEGLPLRLIQARHPLLGREGTGVVPVDIELEKEQRGLIISGGNAGGKTVALKTLGLTALLHLTGLPVPVEEGSSLPMIRDVFALIGDDQSLETHLSTFTAQICALGAVWPELHTKSLILLDEFGAGTDPMQGAALAQAVVDEILRKGSYVAVATHFPSLKAYGLSREDVRSASVLFDPRTRRPLYALAYEMVGTSQTLVVAREQGFPEEVVRKAEAILGGEAREADLAVDRLNRLAAEREREFAAWRERRSALEHDLQIAKDKVRGEKEKVLSEIRRNSQQVVREWKEQRISKRQAMEKLSEARRRASATGAEPMREEERATMEEIVLGSEVVYAPWNKSGTVTARDEKKNVLKVDFDGVSMWVDPGQVRTSKPAKASPAPGGAGAGLSAGGSDAARLRLNLIGMRREEAARALEKFLDRAVLAGLQHLEVVHGKGEGVLRNEVHALLREIPYVKGFGLATADQGGDGVTLVELD